MDILSYKLGKNAGGGGSADLDWSAIGFNSRPEAINTGYAYAIEMQNNFVKKNSYSSAYEDNKNIIFVPELDTSIATVVRYMFRRCISLISVAPLDTSSATNFQSMFDGCVILRDIPILDTTNALNLRDIFNNCSQLSNQSLNNIMKMCINAKKITDNKTLYYLGINSAQATTCQSLSNYNDFISAGWTTGY